MPFTQVTLINESDNDADARVHIAPVNHGEDWVPVQANAGQTGNQPYGQDDVDKIYATHPTGQKGRETRVTLSGGTNPGTLKLGADIPAPPNHVIQSVTIRVDPAGAGMLHAFLLDTANSVMSVQSQPMT